MYFIVVAYVHRHITLPIVYNLYNDISPVIFFRESKYPDFKQYQRLVLKIACLLAETERTEGLIFFSLYPYHGLGCSPVTGAAVEA